MIHTIHGVVDTIEPESLSKKNYVSKRTLESYLKSRPELYQPFDSSNALKYDVLTVDDATYAAAESCLLARRYGHHVTLFVNPWQILNKKPYYTHLLNCAIDNRRRSKVSYENYEFDLNNFHHIKLYREKIKKHIIMMNELDAIEFSYSISKTLKSETLSMPSYNRTLTIDDLKFLIINGVNIQSHGWSHRCISSLSDEELKLDILLSSQWIQETLTHNVTLYAVPFGKPYVPEKLLRSLKIYCMLCDPTAPVCESHSNYMNRLEITGKLNSGFFEQ